ncbi:MAG: YggT family protein [Pseudomonadota bacterium]|nr:YggT family protein [Pseudomonadota bacterium]
MMPSGYFSQPILFLIEVLFGLYMGIVALRIIMQWAHWEYHNPLVQLIIRATQIPVKFLRHFIPPFGRWDTATLVLLVALAILKLLLMALLLPNLFNVVVILSLAVADIFSLFITLFSASIIIQVILSWIQPHNSYNPITPLISRMNAPLLRPLRQRLPTMGGLDLSPLIALLGLQLLSMLVLPLLTGGL